MVTVVVILLTIIIIYTYFKIKNKYSHWTQKGIKGPSPIPLVGNFGNVITMKESFSGVLNSAYNDYPEEKLVGLYRGFTPILVVRDPELLKHIMVKDFSSFMDRAHLSLRSKTKDLARAEGDTWKILRQKLTPIFTSKKLKEMVPLIQICAAKFIVHVQNFVDNNDNNHEMKSLTRKLSIDIIGSCVFGLDVQAYSDDSKFKKIAETYYKVSTWQYFLILLDMFLPVITKYLNFANRQDVNDLFRNLVNSVIKERFGKPKVRNDFMDLMINLKEEGRVYRRDNNYVTDLEIDDDIIKDQCNFFYATGCETISNVVSYTLYELALNQDLQEKVYKEICTITKKYNSENTYEAINEMTYLQMTVHEFLRKHHILSISRKATSEYVIPGTDITIEKDTIVYFPISALHKDPKYYPKPHEFNPDRFSADNVKMRPQYAFLPFGAGPRNCIGMRFAEFAPKVAFVEFLKHYKVEPSPKTKTEFTYDVKTIPMTDLDDIWLKITRR